ncbi:hypothetical protein [Lentzea sp. NPDC051838]|uniref:hypothetical protein n=1 Tax=Lentzea sp. NPDC051838 TaxID=3154849 RepID=UPI00341EC3D0
MTLLDRVREHFAGNTQMREIDRATGTVTRVHYEVFLVLRDTGKRMTEAGFTGFELDLALLRADGFRSSLPFGSRTIEKVSEWQGR